MLLTSKKIRNLTLLCLVMSLAIFLLQGYIFSKIEFVPLNVVPFIFSSFLGVLSVLLYLYIFSSQRKNRNLIFYISMGLMILLTWTGIADLWLVEEWIFALAFLFGGQELLKTESIENS
jgi:hypothetical protein